MGGLCARYGSNLCVSNDWPYTPFALIEGGRWLLTKSDAGSILAYDLDSPSIETYVLIRPDDKPESYISKLAVCIDRASPTLTLNLALSSV